MDVKIPYDNYTSHSFCQGSRAGNHSSRSTSYAQSCPFTPSCTLLSVSLNVPCSLLCSSSLFPSPEMPAFFHTLYLPKLPFSPRPSFCKNRSSGQGEGEGGLLCTRHCIKCFIFIMLHSLDTIIIPTLQTRTWTLGS